jgi:hypothetical protein
MDHDVKLQLLSSAFADGGAIPIRYSCKGGNFSPPLEIHGVPEGTALLALVMNDPDAPNGGFLHWTMWHLNPDLEQIFENQVPDDARQGLNDSGNMGYSGPCPPSDTHRYIFNLYALGTPLELEAGASREELMKAIENHVIAQTTLMGTFSADQKM